MIIWWVTAWLAASGEQQLQQSCTACHRLDVVKAQRLSRWEWSRELDKMESMGAKIQERKKLLDYLYKNFGNR
jgi:mono/diheme cytochrome c family protein